MHGAMGGGTNGAGHVNMGLPYKAYKAEQVSVMQMMVVGMHTEMAGYERVGMLMQGTAGATEAAGMGPVMHLAIGDDNIRLPSVARPTNALVTPPAYDNSFTEVMIGPEGADTRLPMGVRHLPDTRVSRGMSRGSVEGGGRWCVPWARSLRAVLGRNCGFRYMCSC